MFFLFSHDDFLWAWNLAVSISTCPVLCLACGRPTTGLLPQRALCWTSPCSPLLCVGPSWRDKWDTQSVHPQCRSLWECLVLVFVRRDKKKQNWVLKGLILSLVSLYLFTKWCCHRILSVPVLLTKGYWQELRNHCQSLWKRAKPTSLAKASTPSSTLPLHHQNLAQALPTVANTVAPSLQHNHQRPSPSVPYPISIATAASAYVTHERPTSRQAHVISTHFSASTCLHNKRASN